MTAFIDDLRHAARRLLRRPSGNVLAILVLALGIGLSGAAFSVAWGTLWRGLESADGERLVRLGVVAEGQDASNATLPWEVFAELRRDSAGLERVAAWLPFAVDVGGLDRYPERLNGAMVSAGALEMIGVEPLIGRLITAEEEKQRARVVVIGERLWREQLGGSRDVLGRSLEIYRRPMTVIGVVPEEVRAPYNQELWFPIDADAARNSPWMQALGRLAPGAGLENARAELEGVSRRLATAASAAPGGDAADTSGSRASGSRASGSRASGSRAVVESFEAAYHDVTSRRSLLFALLAAAAVLLISATNAAGLFLASAGRRRRELAVRRALGAGRSRVTRLLLLEIALQSAVAGALGVVLASLGITLYDRLGPVQGPYWIDVRLDPVVLAAMVAITCSVGLGSGIWSARRAARSADSLRAHGGAGETRRGARSLRRLVVVQVGLSTALVAATWWMVEAVATADDPLEPLRRSDLVTFQASTYGTSYARDAEASAQFWDQLVREMAELPQVESAALAPVAGRWGRQDSVTLEGEGGAALSARVAAVSPWAFETLGVPVVAGRGLRPREAASTDVAVVDGCFAERHLGPDPIGRRLRLGRGEEGPWRRVVGVVPSLLTGAPGQCEAAVYVPALSGPMPTAATVVLALRAAVPGDEVPARLELDVRRAALRVDPGLGLYWVHTMAHWVELELRHVERARSLFLVFAGVALALAISGLYGVLSLLVTSRRRELAVRRALGARRRELTGRVVAAGLLQVVAGTVLGLALGWWSLGVLASIFGALSSAWSVLPLTLATFLGCGLLAALPPAWRAGAVDPATALREN